MPLGRLAGLQPCGLQTLCAPVPDFQSGTGAGRSSVQASPTGKALRPCNPTGNVPVRSTADRANKLIDPTPGFEIFAQQKARNRTRRRHLAGLGDRGAKRPRPPEAKSRLSVIDRPAEPQLFGALGAGAEHGAARIEIDMAVEQQHVHAAVMAVLHRAVIAFA